MAKSKAEILQEFIDLYVADPSKRSYDASVTTCYYHNSNTGNRCAFGRYVCVDTAQLEGRSVRHIARLIAPEVDIRQVGNLTVLDRFLLPEYHGHSVDFWSDLQSLHDLVINWSESGFSVYGYSVLESIKEKWAVA